MVAIKKSSCIMFYFYVKLHNVMIVFSPLLEGLDRNTTILSTTSDINASKPEPMTHSDFLSCKELFRIFYILKISMIQLFIVYLSFIGL